MSTQRTTTALGLVVGAAGIGILWWAGIDNLTGGAGAGVAVGSAVQLTGVLVATVAGLLALRRRTVHT